MKICNSGRLFRTVFGETNIFINGPSDENKVTVLDDPNPSPFGPTGFNLNPVGAGGNYISFPMVADIGFAADAGQKASFSNLEITNFTEYSLTK